MQAPRATPSSPLLKTSAATISALHRLKRQSLLLRLGLAVVLHLTTSDSTFAPDQETYHQFSLSLAQYWSGDSLIYPGRLLVPGEPIGYYYIVASLYFLLAGVGFTACHHHPCACQHEALRERKADAPGTAGNDDGAPGHVKESVKCCTIHAVSRPDGLAGQRPRHCRP